MVVQQQKKKKREQVTIKAGLNQQLNGRGLIPRILLFVPFGSHPTCQARLMTRIPLRVKLKTSCRHGSEQSRTQALCCVYCSYVTNINLAGMLAAPDLCPGEYFSPASGSCECCSCLSVERSCGQWRASTTAPHTLSVFSHRSAGSSFLSNRCSYDSGLAAVPNFLQCCFFWQRFINHEVETRDIFYFFF